MNEHDDWWQHSTVTEQGTVITFGFLPKRIDQWGRLLFLDLPMVGAILKRGDFFVAIEAEDAITFSAAPVAGKIIAINPALNGWVTKTASGSEWLMKVLVKK